MRVAVTSDTHGRHVWDRESPGEVFPCDVFIHAGDLSAGGTLEETIFELGWLRGLTRRAHLLIVPGNHDRAMQLEMPAIQRVLDDHRVLGSVDILIDRAIEIGGKVFYGSPWTPPFHDWYFMATEDELREKYRAMPRELDMLITHGPPRGILDPGWQQPHAGSEALREAVSQRVIDHHVFGHLHGAGGQSEMWTDGCTYYNVAACNEAYQIVNKPRVIEL